MMDAPGPLISGSGSKNHGKVGSQTMINTQRRSSTSRAGRGLNRSGLCDIRNILIALLFAAWSIDQLLDGVRHQPMTVNYLQNFDVHKFGSSNCKGNKASISNDDAPRYASNNDIQTAPGYAKSSSNKVTVMDLDGVRTVFENSSGGQQLAPIPPHEPLPDWRLVTECSTYAVDCPVMLIHKRGGFLPYPFHFFDSTTHDWKPWPGTPQAWTKVLKAMAPNYDVPYDKDSFYVYPEENDPKTVKKCLLRRTTTPYDEQLNEVLHSLGRNEELDMIAFTISDISYAKDEIHDFFEVSADKVEFGDAAFMVALDVATVELGCKYGYPVIPSETVLSNNGELRSKVQNTKFVVSRDILKHGVSFLFFEMDVYWLKSPLPVLREHQEDIVVSSHFVNAWSPNIGIYAVRATPGGLEFFEVALDLLQKSPDTHDQVVFTSVRDKVRRDLHHEEGPDWEFMTKLYKEPVPPEPTITNQITTYPLDTLLVSAQMRLQINEHTIAVHPLCNLPLMSPHGKKMVAKEVGAWYGFRGPAGDGGYYHRRGDKRRYLLLDGRAWGGLSSTMNLGEDYGYYHQPGTFKWTLATLVVLARRTNRILVLPKVVGDEANGYVWWLLDLKTVEDQVEIRETNFPSNPKSWVSDDVPFNSVARTALDYVRAEANRGWRMTAQVNDQPNSLRAWKIATEQDPLEAWFGINTLDPDIKDVEALFVNPQYINAFTQWTSVCGEVRKTQMIAREIRHMTTRRLKWCDGQYISRTPAKTTAEQDCYGRGELFATNCEYDD